MSTTLATRDTATTWTIDPAHTEVGFDVKHMMFAKVHGRFEELEGTLEVGADGAPKSVDVTIGVASISTGQEKRDEHLRSGDFFAADTFPKMRFEMREVRGRNGDAFRLLGSLTIRDVTKDVELEVTETGTGTDPWGNERFGFQAEASIDRRDFGLTWNQALETGGVLVGNEVKISIEGQAVLNDA